MRTILTIAGSDSSGGAGIQADIKTISANGAYGASVITAITAQNTTGVFAVEVLSTDIVKAQLEAVFTDLSVDAVKIGMVSDKEMMHVIQDAISTYQPSHIIIDPVMVSTTGHRLLEADQIEALKRILLPLATLITPNLQEAEVLIDRSITSLEEMKQAALELEAEVGARVLLKGGHFPITNKERTFSVDVLSTGDQFTREWIETESTHGTGCSLSSAIATQLAHGYDLRTAISKGKDYVHEGILRSYKIGTGSNPIHHFHQLWKEL